MKKKLSTAERLDKIENLLLSGKTVMNFEEVVAYTGLSPSWLYKLSAKSLIPCSQPAGKLLFFEKAKIDLWLLRNTKKNYADTDSEAATFVALKK